MDSEQFNYTIEYEIDKDITETGIYYSEVILEAYKVSKEKQGFHPRQISFLSKYSSNEVFAQREKDLSFKKYIKNANSVMNDVNKKLSRKNLLKIRIKVLKYLGEIQKPAPVECQKPKILKENIKTTSILSPPITSSVLTSSHRSMSLDDL
jgi:hypothetical protein